MYLPELLLPRIEALHNESIKSWLIGAGPISGYSLPILCAIGGLLVGWILSRIVNFILSTFFRAFNFGFKVFSFVYTKTVGVLLRVAIVVLLGYVGLLYQTYKDFVTTPTGFIPSQDMGYLLVNVQLPDATASGRTWETLTRLEKIAKDTPGVKFTQVVGGQSLLLSRVWVQLRLDVRRPGRVCQSERP